MHAVCRPAILEVRRNHNMLLYFHDLLPNFSQSEYKYPGEEVGILRWAEIKLHISGHGGIVKIGVKQNKYFAMKKTVKKTKFMCFVLIKGWSKYAKQNKTLELNFVKRRARQFVPFLIFSVVNVVVVTIFAQKKLFCYICKTQGGFDYF